MTASGAGRGGPQPPGQPRRAGRALPRPDRAAQRRAGRVHHGHRRGRAPGPAGRGPADAGRTRRRCRRCSACPPRSRTSTSPRASGPRSARTLFADFVPPVDDHVVDAAAPGRHDQPGQDQHAGVRAALLHRERRRAAGPHAVGPDPARPAAPAAAPPPRWRPGWSRSRRAATAAARSGSRPASAACSGSRPPAAGSATARSSATSPAWPGTARWPAASATRRRCSTRWRCRCRATRTGRRRCRRARRSSSYAGRDPGRLRIGRYATPAVDGAEVHPDCLAAYEAATAAAGRASGTRSRTSTRRSRPRSIGVFETVWARARRPARRSTRPGRTSCCR